MKPEYTITTYLKPERAYTALHSYTAVFYDAYRIKDYKLRKTSEISPASLSRILVLLNQPIRTLSDCGPSWFRIVHYIREWKV